MEAGDIAFVVLAINPLGGLLMAIPLGILKLGYTPVFSVITGVPLAYLQVIAVDLCWSQLCRWSWWNRLLERRRSPRVERLATSRGAFWSVVLLTPVVGPWMIMAVMRYANVPQRHVALPILLGLTWIAALVAGLSVWAPRWVSPGEF